MSPSSDESVQQSLVREHPSEKRWTIMAAMLGANMGFALFHGLEQRADPIFLRHIALIIVVCGLPFQAVWFMIHAFVMEHHDRIEEDAMVILSRLQGTCQLVSYLSMTGMALMFYSIHWTIGVAFLLSGAIAVLMVRLAISQADELAAAP